MVNESANPAGNEDSSKPALALRLFEPVDIAILVFFRIGFGLSCLRLIWLLMGDVQMRDGRPSPGTYINRYFVEPDFNFKYFGFGWVEAWPGDGMYWHFAVLGVLSLFITLGLFYRLSAALFCLGFTYVFLLEQARYMNHYYLLCLIGLLLVFIPAHRAFSLDALLRPSIRAQTAPAWTIWLLRFQVGLVYFYAGVAKLNYDWLSGKTVELLMEKRDITDEMVIMFMSYSGVLFDLLVVPLLLWRKTRVWALIAALIFNISNSHVFDIDIFPWFMICSTLLFFSPSWPCKLAALILPVRAKAEKPAHAAANSLTSRQRLIVGVLGIYVAIQVLLPLRHHLYAGDTNWTNNGHKFAWRMLLRKKIPDTPIFRYTYVEGGELKQGRIGLIPPPGHVRNHWQIYKMLIVPDMILQFAHMQAEYLRENDYKDVKIYAYVPVSLTGRPYQSLVDPAVDLANEPRRFLTPYPWVLPLKENVGRR